ncbi:hypothetical protein [Propionimicrobium sp. PCR01-08-3]|uniref:hypothetical protein n=1 Tax=Propionimicrobium sp. PCR01-08-3 TaxID=3052086 RepID=UPI00255C2ADB|nr:hypothetical protein [Propionimicrobium sp. PCR01-08-3]WIY84319.1 hypothetical protein QQ658_15270 [Propionimicrobium sp. PCR01-08-3]
MSERAAGTLTADDLGHEVTTPAFASDCSITGALVEVQHWALGADRRTIVHVEHDGHRTQVYLPAAATVVVR